MLLYDFLITLLRFVSSFTNISWPVFNVQKHHVHVTSLKECSKATYLTLADAMAPPAVLMVGTGEYTTGFVSGAASTSDKKVGVVGLTCK